MLSQTLAVSILAASTLASAQQHGTKRSRAHMNKVAKRHEGGNGARMTYYDTSVGLGSCGIWHAPSEYTVALNSAQLAQYGGGYPSSACGKTITISYKGKTAQATIQDECPTCPWGGLDFSQGLFEHFASTDEGVIYADWWYGGGSPAPASQEPEPTTSEWVAPTTSTVEWVAPTTTSSSEWVAPTTSSSAEWVAPSSASEEWVSPTTTSSVDAAKVTVGLNVEASSAAAPAPSSSAAPAEESSYVAPTPSSSSEEAWVAPTSTEAAPVAPTSTEEAWIAPSSTEEASASAPTEAAAAEESWTSSAWKADEPAAEEPIFAADGSMCSSPSSILLFTNATLLYNGTTLDLMDAMTNVTLAGNITMPYLFGPNSTVGALESSDAIAKVGGYQNATDMLASNATMDQIVGYCFNSSLYPIVFAPNGTITNGTSPSGSALNATSTFEDLLVQMGFNTTSY